MGMKEPKGIAKPIPGTVNQPKPPGALNTPGTVSSAKDVPNQQIPNTVSGPKP